MDTNITLKGSKVQEFYKNKSILITGATGFIGKALIEKLLRSCPDLHKIYVIIRPKYKMTGGQRLTKMLQSSVFDTLRAIKKDFGSKIMAVNGDISEPNLGLSVQDLNLLKREIQIIIHSAANVKFNEALDTAFHLHLGGTQKLIDLALTMSQLVSFVHISTAYGNGDSDREEIDEIVYQRHSNLSQLINQIKSMTRDEIEAITPKLLQTNPNTYTYTKSLTECLLQQYQNILPITILRPAAVAAALSEPYPGWVESKTGASGLLLLIGLGQMTSILADPDKHFDLVPVDLFVNLVILTCWSSTLRPLKEVQVYNCCPTNPITNKDFFELSAKMTGHSYTPFDNAVRSPSIKIFRSSILYNIYDKLWTLFPAYLTDKVTSLTRRPIDDSRKKMEGYNKVKSVGEALSYFLVREWKFNLGNMRTLHGNLEPIDKKLFPILTHDIHWPEFMANYAMGIRKFTLKQSDQTLKDAQHNLRRKYWASKSLKIFIVCVIILLIVIVCIVNSIGQGH